MQTYDLELSDGIWSWQEDRDSSLLGCLSNEHTAELMGTPTTFPLIKSFIVTSDLEEDCYIVKITEILLCFG
uniref:Uncharacterized protein n=1 Tax=Solanum tuberosum TaxID=4113 RepID=M1ATN7_SOLTU